MVVDKFRPLRWDEENRRSWITEDFEVTFRAVSDANGNIIYLARARVGTEDFQPRWQIKYLNYDSNNNPYNQLWPQNSDGVPSSEYVFPWIDSTQYAITGISKANPAVVTCTNSFSNGDQVVITGVVGMTEVNFSGNATNVYTVANRTGSSFELQSVNSTAYTTYTSGGTAQLASFAGYTYA